jgi:hypothetical protein
MLDKLNQLNNIGDETYQSWSDEQRRQEIGNLVQGFKNGLPVQILCQLATSIAGSPALASQHLCAFLTLKERKAIIKKESGANEALRSLLQATLL